MQNFNKSKNPHSYSRFRYKSLKQLKHTQYSCFQPYSILRTPILVYHPLAEVTAYMGCAISFEDAKKCKFNTNPLLAARRIFYGARHVDFCKVHIKSFLTHFFRSPYLKNSLRQLSSKFRSEIHVLVRGRLFCFSKKQF